MDSGGPGKIVRMTIREFPREKERAASHGTPPSLIRRQKTSGLVPYPTPQPAGHLRLCRSHPSPRFPTPQRIESRWGMEPVSARRMASAWACRLTSGVCALVVVNGSSGPLETPDNHPGCADARLSGTPARPHRRTAPPCPPLALTRVTPAGPDHPATPPTSGRR